MKQFKNILFTFLLFISCNSSAGVYLGLSLELGGDTIAKTSDEDLNFGGGIGFIIGYEQTMESGNKLRFTIGSLSDDISGFDNSFNIITYDTNATAIELTYLMPNDHNNFGFGVSLHQSAEVEITVNSIPNSTTKIDDSIGFFALYEFNVSNGLDIGIRYTLRDYEISGTTFDANSLGLTLSKSF